MVYSSTYFIVDWINENLEHAIILIPVFAFAEACIGIGLFISGIFLVAISTIILDQQAASLSSITALAFIGALLGDHVGYYVGKSMGPQVEQIGLVKKRIESFNKAKSILKKFGPFAIFFGRFIPAIRSIIPALLGITKFEKITFTLLDTLACFLWSIALAAIIFGVDNLI